MHTADDAEYRRYGPMTQPGFPSLPPRHRTILVVDDEDIVRALVTRALREAGYGVIQAQHGAAAIALLDSQGRSIDLVISDLVMPGVTGLSLLETVTQHHPRTPVILVSGFATGEDVMDAARRGAFRVLRKPFPPRVLLDVVQEALQARRRGPRP